MSISLIAIDKPTPKIGPIKGDINIAPITTGIEFVFSPIEATKMEHIRIQAVAPLNWISSFYSFNSTNLISIFSKVQKVDQIYSCVRK